MKGVFPLGAYAGSTVVLRFHYKTDAATLGEGFYVDDIYPVNTFGSSTILSNTITATHYDLSRPIGTYYYEVKAKDGDGQWGYWSQRKSMVETGAGVPGEVAMRPGLRFENPVHSGGKVVFSAPASAAGQISVFNAAGRLVRTLDARSGQAVWDLSGEDGSAASPGIYFVRFAGADASAVGKLVVLK